MKQDADLPRVRRRGFTLIETLVVVAVLAMIAIMATPSFLAWHVRDQVDARARALLSTLPYARSEGVLRGVRVTVWRVDATLTYIPGLKFAGVDHSRVASRSDRDHGWLNRYDRPMTRAV